MIGRHLVQHLTAEPTFALLCGDRIFPAAAPAGVAYPLVTYSVTAGFNEDRSHDGGVGVITDVLQLSSWAKTYQEARQLARILRAILRDHSGTLGDFAIDDIAWAGADRDTFDNTADAYGVISTVEITYREA